jgi:hypothetical protein
MIEHLKNAATTVALAAGVAALGSVMYYACYGDWPWFQ